MLTVLFCGLWCCLSLRVSQPGDDKANSVYGILKNARRGEYCSRMQSVGNYYDGDEKFDIAEEVFQDHANDSLEVLKCFVDTMNLTLDDAFGEYGETLLFPAVESGQLESVKHLT